MAPLALQLPLGFSTDAPPRLLTLQEARTVLAAAAAATIATNGFFSLRNQQTQVQQTNPQAWNRREWPG